MRRVRRAGVLLPPLLLLAGPMSARAYDAETRDLEHVQVTATRRAVNEFDVAVAVSQVDNVSIRQENPGVLAEMLRGLPGAFFQQTTPGQGIPIIRGLKGSQVLHLVDGMRLNNAFFRDAPNQYLGLVDAFAVDRIEVVRGAAGSRHGADAMGGVVNVLTSEPAFSDGSWRQESEIHGAFSGADDGWVGRAATRGGGRDFAASLGVTWQDRQDRETGRGVTIVPSGYRSKAADATVRFKPGTRSELMLNVQLLEQPSTPRVDELVPGFGQERSASSDYYFEPNRRRFVHARYRLDDGGRWFDLLEAHLARQVVTDDRRTRDFGVAAVTREANESVLDGVTLQFNSSLAGGSLVTWGVEYYTDEVSSGRTVLAPGQDDPEPVRARFPDGSTMDSAAAYVSAEFYPGRRFTLSSGLRYSAFDIRLPETADLDAVELTPSDLTGDVNLLFELTPALHLAANVGRGFRPPNVFDLATLGPRPGNRFNVANPALEPESVWSYDVGLKARTGDLQYELFVFYLDYRDRITSVPTGAFTPEGRTIVRSENRNRVELYGLESGIRWTLSETLEVYGAVNYTRAEERDDAGARFDGDRIPPLNGKLGVVYRPVADWRAEAYAAFAGAQDRLSPRDVRDPRIDPDGTPGWGTLNLVLSWQANDVLQWGIRLENAFDRAYREHGSGIDAPGRNVGAWLNAVW